MGFGAVAEVSQDLAVFVGGVMVRLSSVVTRSAPKYMGTSMGGWLYMV